MLASMIISGGPLQLQYDLANASSPVQLERSSWRIAGPVRRSSLVGRDPYTEIAESFTVSILGANERACWVAYNDFVNFMSAIQQARSKPDYDIYQFSVKSSTDINAKVWTTRILGSIDDATPVVGPPTDPITDASTLCAMRGISVSFRRKGRFIVDNLALNGVGSTTDTVTDAKGQYEIVFPAQSVDSPAQITFYTPNAEGRYEITNGMLLLSNHDNLVADSSFRAPDGLITSTVPAGWSSYNDSANLPVSPGANVSRWIAPNNLSQISNFVSLTPIIKWRRALIIVTATGLVPGAAAIMNIQFYSTELNTVVTETVPIVGDSAVHIYNLGVIAIPSNGISSLRVWIKNTTSTLSTILVERILLVNLDQPNVMIARHDFMSSDYNAYIVDPRYLEHVSPVFRAGKGIAFATTAYPRKLRGNMHFSVRLPGVRAIWIKQGGRYWDVPDFPGPGRLTLTMSGVLYPTTLIPQ